MKIGTDRVVLDITRRGYKPTLDNKFPRQRIVVCNPTISAKAFQEIDFDVEGHLKVKGSHLQGTLGMQVLFLTLKYLNLGEFLTIRG